MTISLTNGSQKSKYCPCPVCTNLLFPLLEKSAVCFVTVTVFKEWEPLTTTKLVLTGSPKSAGLSQGLAGKNLSPYNSSIKPIPKLFNSAEVTKTCVQHLLIFHAELAHAERSSCNLVMLSVHSITVFVALSVFQ